jgi:hypothetical protein
MESVESCGNKLGIRCYIPVGDRPEFILKKISPGPLLAEHSEVNYTSTAMTLAVVPRVVELWVKRQSLGNNL